MSLFQMVDRNQRLLKEFMDKCDNNIVLSNCYKNKLELGCTYNKSVEQKISNIDEDGFSGSFSGFSPGIKPAGREAWPEQKNLEFSNMLDELKDEIEQEE